MPEQARFSKAAWVPLASGLGWLWIAPGNGVIFGALAAVPGCLLLGAGVASLFMRRDARTAHFGALGGLLGALVGVVALLAVGFWAGLSLLALSVWSVVEVGAHAWRDEPAPDGVPAPELTARFSAEIAVDCATLAVVLPLLPVPARAEAGRINAEMSDARDLFDEQGWLEEPAGYHRVPPALESPKLRASEVRGIDYEEMIFESEYEPHRAEPGRERWLSYRANRTARVRLLRHHDANRPWLICIHGYQLGYMALDTIVFPPDWLHHGLGLNIALPLLPLHGARKIGRRSGDGFLAGELLDTLHAEAQAIWELRRLVGWIREQGGSAIGVYGLSLGGYTAALLSALEDGLACAIAGIPLVDIPDVTIHHGLLGAMRSHDGHGLDVHSMREIARVVSPLALAPRVSVERRFLFGAVGDRLVPPGQTLRLWEHWERPRIDWFAGGHMTFRVHASTHALVEEGLRASALAF